MQADDGDAQGARTGRELGSEQAPVPRRAGDAHAGQDPDAARGRLEDLLLALPYDRALPDLPVLLDRAGVPDELLHRDERILKVLHEAVIARPFGQAGEAARIRTQIELLTLEVELLTDRLRDPDSDPDAVDEARRRLAEVTDQLGHVRELL